MSQHQRDRQHHGCEEGPGAAPDKVPGLIVSVSHELRKSYKCRDQECIWRLPFVVEAHRIGRRSDVGVKD